MPFSVSMEMVDIFRMAPGFRVPPCWRTVIAPAVVCFSGSTHTYAAVQDAHLHRERERIQPHRLASCRG